MGAHASYEKLKTVKGARESLPKLEQRRAQLNRALWSLTDEGQHLIYYLKAMRSDLMEERSRQDPEDIRKNTELYAEVNMLRRIIADWEDSKDRLAVVNAELINIK